VLSEVPNFKRHSPGPRSELLLIPAVPPAPRAPPLGSCPRCLASATAAPLLSRPQGVPARESDQERLGGCASGANGPGNKAQLDRLLAVLRLGQGTGLLLGGDNVVKGRGVEAVRGAWQGSWGGVKERKRSGSG
jgi:hypothetical protein